MSLVITNPPRLGRKLAEAFVRFGVATVHEAQARSGLLAASMRPIYPGAKIAGSAITVSIPPGDNWMLHVVVEQCQAGDVLALADDDGVVVVPRTSAETVLGQAHARAAKEAQTRARLQAGDLGLDIYDMRAKLRQKGLVYRPADLEA